MNERKRPAMPQSPIVVLTGAMGAGKTTVLNILESRGFLCVPESARIVLASQRRFKGSGVPETDPSLFCSLMLEHSKEAYRQYSSQSFPVFTDRAIPDLKAYCSHFGIDDSGSGTAAEEFIYFQKVFVFNAWHSIYANDEERKMTYELSAQFGAEARQVYHDLGYQIIDMPEAVPEQRADFILKKIGVY